MSVISFDSSIGCSLGIIVWPCIGCPFSSEISTSRSISLSIDIENRYLNSLLFYLIRTHPVYSIYNSSIIVLLLISHYLNDK